MMIFIENDDFVDQQEDVRAAQWEKDGLPPGTSRRCTQDDHDNDDDDDDHFLRWENHFWNVKTIF